MTCSGCSSVAADLKLAITESGVQATVHKQCSTDTYTEYITENPHPAHTTPMIRAFFSDYVFTADTHIEIGDRLVLPGGKELLVLVKEPEYCANTVMDYLASGYTINTVGTVYDYNQNPGYDSNYIRQQPWTAITNGTNVKGVMVDRLFRTELADIGLHSQESELERIHLYLPGCLNVVSGQRFTTSDGVKYHIEYVEKFRFPGINLAFLINDNRPD